MKHQRTRFDSEGFHQIGNKITVHNISDEVQDEVYEAFNNFCKDKIKQHKLAVHKAETKMNDYKIRHNNLVTDLKGLDAEKLWKEFFETDLCAQASPYEQYLMNK